MEKKLLLTSLKQHGVLGGVLFLFLMVALLFLFLAFYLDEMQAKIFFIGMGGVFGTISLFFLYSLISSIIYYYEKGLIKKYGDYIQGHIIDIKKEFLSEENLYIYFLEYTYTYLGKEYTNTEVFDREDIYKHFKIQQKIPLQILTLDPKKSQLRVIKYKKQYSA